MSEKKSTSAKVAQAVTEATKDTIAISAITTGINYVIQTEKEIGVILILTGFGLLLIDRLAHFFA